MIMHIIADTHRPDTTHTDTYSQLSVRMNTCCRQSKRDDGSTRHGLVRQHSVPMHDPFRGTEGRLNQTKPSKQREGTHAEAG